MTNPVDIYGGVDTHRDVHVAAVVDTAPGSDIRKRSSE